jgi:choline dehydrogenase
MLRSISGVNPLDPIQIEANTMSHPDDLKAAIACVQLCREIGNSAALRPFTKREVMPGNLKGAELENFIRDGASTYHHQTCTAKMGRDPMSVVDGNISCVPNVPSILSNSASNMACRANQRDGEVA